MSRLVSMADRRPFTSSENHAQTYLAGGGDDALVVVEALEVQSSSLEAQSSCSRSFAEITHCGSQSSSLSSHSRAGMVITSTCALHVTDRVGCHQTSTCELHVTDREDL